MILRRIGVLSAAKLCGVIYAVVGLITGIFFSVMSVFSAVSSHSQFGTDVVFGVGAFIILPTLYGLLGFAGGLLGAALYNLVAGAIGGLELEFEETRA